MPAQPNSIKSRLKALKVGFAHGEAFPLSSKRTLQNKLAELRGLVAAGKLPKWKWDYEMVLGNPPMYFVWKERKRI